jgi:hypothetical protein
MLWSSPLVNTDVEVLAERARFLEGEGMLREALWTGRGVLRTDGICFPALSTNPIALSREDGEDAL